MKGKKLLSTLAMSLVGLFTFSSCGLFLDEDKAVERISTVQPEKQVNRTVITEDEMVIDIDGVRTEVDFDAEAEKYYTLDEGTGRGDFYRYGDWIYYEYCYAHNLLRVNETIKVGLMRSNIYTGETENVYDFGETYLDVYSRDVRNDRYFFFHAQGVLKIFDMETNQFTYEHRINTKDEIKKTLGVSNLHNYTFSSYSAMDYVKGGAYYHYTNDGSYEMWNDVPEWLVAEEGSISLISLYRIENYVYTASYNDIEEERKAYDLVERVEVDYMTVVKPLKDANREKRQANYKENEFLALSPGVLVQTEDKNYELYSDWENYVIGSGTISRYELDENGFTMRETAVTIDGAYLKEHNKALQQLSKLWYPNRDSGLSCGRICLSGGRVFFLCYNYCGTWVMGSTSASYLCELDPLTMEVEYLGYYTSSLDAMYVH